MKPDSQRNNFTKVAAAGLMAIIGLCFLSSCTSIYYENPQPAGQENMNEFPKKLLGTYVDTEDGDTVIVVYSDGFSLKINENDVKIPLSDKSVLRKYKSFYFLSLQQEDTNLWTVYVVKTGKKKTLDLYDISTEEGPLEQLRAITEVKEYEQGEEKSFSMYINPDLAEMDQIIKSGLLKPTQKLKR